MIFYILLISIILISLITFILYYIDKKRAKNNEWRIKERTLLIFTLILGSFGALFGIYLLRHKTKHWYFILTLIIGIIINITLLVLTYNL